MIAHLFADSAARVYRPSESTVNYGFKGIHVFLRSERSSSDTSDTSPWRLLSWAKEGEIQRISSGKGKWGIPVINACGDTLL